MSDKGAGMGWFIGAVIAVGMSIAKNGFSAWIVFPFFLSWIYVLYGCFF